MGLFSGLAGGATSRGAARIFSHSAETIAGQTASRDAFRGMAGAMKSRMDSTAIKHPKAAGVGMAADFMGFVHSNDTAAGAFYGGAAGAVGGIMSNDRDVGMFKGAAMGAIGGARAMRSGFRGGTVAGATLGGLGGMFSDDTSIMGGAFMGGVAGASLTSKYAKGFNAVRTMGKRRQTGMGPHSRVADRGTITRTSRAGARGGGDWRKAGRATFNAMKRDVGQSWRGRRTRASKNTSTIRSNS